MPCILSACDVTILERRDKLILLETVLQSHTLCQLSSINRTLDGILTEGCGQIDTKIDYLHAVLLVCQASYLRNEAQAGEQGLLLPVAAQ